jgi:tetratricopeptide (TPR) repeat protein
VEGNAQIRFFPKPKDDGSSASAIQSRQNYSPGSIQGYEAAGSPGFANLPQTHPLADVWNDPEFTRRLYGSYGFLSEAEPRMTPEEQIVYRDQIVPLLAGEPKASIPLLEPLVRPESSAVFDFTLATVYFQVEDFERAIEWYEQALSKFPDYRRAQRNLALVLVRAGKYQEAIKPLLRTIALGGADGRVYGLLGFSYLNQERALAAEGAYKQALVYDPDNLDFRLGLVKSYLGTAQYDPALALLDELISDHPERDALWTLQANVYIQKEQPAKAAITLELLRRMGKATPASLFLLGDLHLSGDNQGLALEAYMAAIESGTPEDIGRALRPAEILVSQGAWAEAKKLFAHIRSAGGELPVDVENKLLRLEVKLAMAMGSGEDAIKVLDELLIRNPLDADALILAGDYFGRTGEPEKAAIRYEAAAKLEGYEADAMVKHAQLLVQTQKYTQAIELLRKAQKVQPRDNVQRYLEKVEQVARATTRS